MTYIIVRITVTTCFGLFSGLMTTVFTLKKDPSRKYFTGVGLPLALAKLFLGFWIGMTVLLALYSVLSVLLFLLTIAGPVLIAVHSKLDNSRDVFVLAIEFLVLAVITEAMGSYVLPLFISQ